MSVRGSRPSACASSRSRRSTTGLEASRTPSRADCWTRALVHLVAERGDLEPPARHDLAEVERAAPVDPGVDVQLARPELLRVPADDLATRVQRGRTRRRARADLLGEEERGHAVPGVAADNAEALDHALVGERRELADELEPALRREAARQRTRSLDVGEQDRRLVAGGVEQLGHARE